MPLTTMATGFLLKRNFYIFRHTRAQYRFSMTIFNGMFNKNAGNNIVSLAEIDRWVVDTYPQLNNKPVSWITWQNELSYGRLPPKP